MTKRLNGLAWNLAHTAPISMSRARSPSGAILSSGKDPAKVSKVDASGAVSSVLGQYRCSRLKVAPADAVVPKSMAARNVSA
jgi:hypothetical protein